MYKLIVSDLDETLINSNGQISPKNISAIKKAINNGVRFVPASGRSFNNFQHILQLLDLDNQKGEYSISYNGGAITENKDNRLIESTELPFELVKELFAIGVAQDVLIHVFTLDAIHTYNMNNDEKAYLDNEILLNLMHEPSVNHLKSTPVMKINFQHSDASYLQQIEKNMSKALKNLLDINYSSNRYIEFNPKGVNKGNALLQLLADLNIQSDEVIAIGDNMNDRTMIKVAGTGIAVGNAVPELKENANYICRATHDEDAIAEVIYKYILN